jgi:hypothetical protein
MAGQAHFIRLMRLFFTIIFKSQIAKIQLDILVQDIIGKDSHILDGLDVNDSKLPPSQPDEVCLIALYK